MSSISFSNPGQKDVEREELNRQLQEWLAAGNRIKEVRFGTPSNDMAEPGGKLVKGKRRWSINGS